MNAEESEYKNKIIQFCCHIPVSMVLCFLKPCNESVLVPEVNHHFINPNLNDSCKSLIKKFEEETKPSVDEISLCPFTTRDNSVCQFELFHGSESNYHSAGLLLLEPSVQLARFFEDIDTT